MTSNSIQDVARRMVDFAIEIAPSYPEQLIVNLLNSFYLNRPALRKEMIEEVNRYIERLAVRERHNISIEPVTWMNELEADNLASSLLGDIDANGRLEGGARKEFEAFVKPLLVDRQGVQFLPSASISIGRHSLGNSIVSPRKCREILGVGDEDARTIVDFLNGLSIKLSSTDANVQNIMGGSQPTAGNGTIKVAVAPYADTLFLPALIYSVSDLFDSERLHIEFSPASFFRTPDDRDHGSMGNLTEPGKFALGYCTYESKETFSRSGYRTSRVFEAGISKSILTLANPSAFGTSIHMREVTNISFLGDFAPHSDSNIGRASEGILIDEVFSSLNAAAASSGIDTSTELFFLKPQTLTNYVNLASDEYDFINLISSLNLSEHALGFRSMKELIGITISTDAHIAAVSNGLIDPPTGISTLMIGSYYQHQFGLKAQRKLSCLAWGGNVEEDALSWYFYTGKLGAHKKQDILFGHVVDRLYARFRESVRTTISIEQKPDIDQAYLESSKNARTLAAVLMTPVLISQPYYYGVLTRIPAIDWLHKIASENGHLEYVPYCLTSLERKRGQLEGEQMNSNRDVS